ncbi:MAG: c-type cytochrome [Planctomycetes bacterium]|nr:c-type cytochrome [Planctomycetota bacterium]
MTIHLRLLLPIYVRVPFFVAVLLLFWSQICYAASDASLSLPRTIQLPEVYCGEIIPYTIEGRNTSAETIEISKIKTSCGCTSAELKNKIIPAGNAFSIKGEMNTNQRLGDLKKSVRVYEKDRRSPYFIQLVGKTKSFPREHLPIEGKNMFVGQCAVCHVNQGVNMMGQQLYLADCAMCHGIFREGISAKPLSLEKMNAFDIPSLHKQISSGVNIHNHAFAEEEGGPLKEKQILSLVKTLRHKTVKRSTLSTVTGQSLYLNLCSSCHGSRKTGPIGPELGVQKMKKMSREKIISILTEGLPGTVMSSFHSDKKGVLTKGEIEMLSDYLQGRLTSRRRSP